MPRLPFASAYLLVLAGRLGRALLRALCLSRLAVGKREVEGDLPAMGPAEHERERLAEESGILVRA